MKAATVALRDQLAMVLRDAGGPLSTVEIAQRMPPIVREDFRCVPQWCGRPRLNPYVISDECMGNGFHRLTRQCFHTDIYRHLVALERLGRCTRLRPDGYRSVYWFWTGAPAALLDELEALWAAS